MKDTIYIENLGDMEMESLYGLLCITFFMELRRQMQLFLYFKEFSGGYLWKQEWQ